LQSFDQGLWILNDASGAASEIIDWRFTRSIPLPAPISDIRKFFSRNLKG
jgi:hypothetical protein